MDGGGGSRGKIWGDDECGEGSEAMAHEGDSKFGSSVELEVDHEAGADGGVVTKGLARDRTTVVDVSEEHVELEAGVGIPIPIESQGDALADAAGDVVVGGVEIGPAGGNLPSTPAAPYAAAAAVDKEEVFEGLDAGDGAHAAIPGNVLAGEEIGDVGVGTVKMEIGPEAAAALEVNILKLGDELDGTGVENRLGG